MAGVLDVEDTDQKRRKEEGGGHSVGRHGCMRGNNIETRGLKEVGGETVI